MIIFTKLKWRGDRVAHILRKHGINPGEVEEVCFRNPLILKGSGKGEKRLYYVFGQTEADKYLSIVLKPLTTRIALPVTARAMSLAERRKYQKQRR